MVDMVVLLLLSRLIADCLMIAKSMAAVRGEVSNHRSLLHAAAAGRPATSRD
jgi:hypothetical protein